jgi:transposase
MISSWLLGRGPACIVKPYSEDLRERAVTEVEGGLSRQQAAALFDLGISTVVH